METAGTCGRCRRTIRCDGGFLQGIVLSDGTLVCLACWDAGSGSGPARDREADGDEAT